MNPDNAHIQEVPVAAQQPANGFLAGPLPASLPDLTRAQLSETTIIWTTSLGHALCHLGELIFPSVMVAMMHEFHLAPDQVTWLALPCYVLFGLGALPVG